MERYDRQIRLWGQHGQNKLASAQVCLINASATGTEILKNLCLSGVGSFTIIDSVNVIVEDVGNNFFLTHDHIGKNRGQSVTEYLSELNDEVCGQSIEEPLESLLSEDKDEFWIKFNCVITSGQLNLDLYKRLCEKCWQLNVPLMDCKTLGFIGYLRLQFREHLVIDSHPDHSIADFRLDRPFPELRAYLDGIKLDLNNDADEKLGQYPYIVIIYKFLREWQNQNDYPEDRLPSNYEEKHQLKTMIKTVSDRLMNARDNVELENFQEACKAVNTAVNPSQSIPDELQSIFEHANNYSFSGCKFWLIIKSIKTFVSRNNNQLPVSGVLPDMASSSANYIALQNIYRIKSREDAEQIYNYVQELNVNTMCITMEEVSLLCKNIRHINLLKSKRLSDEPEVCYNGDGDEDDATFMCLGAVSQFYSIYGCYPGEQYDQMESDVSRLKDTLKRSALPKVIDEKLYEICRYGGSELPAVASFMGGCGSQEVLKLITNQYVPINGSLLYNSKSSTTTNWG